MASKIKGTEVKANCWAQHFRTKGKRFFWHRVRTKLRSIISKIKADETSC